MVRNLNASTILREVLSRQNYFGIIKLKGRDHMPTTEECFVIMPFTTPDGYESDHFKKIYDQLFEPAIKKAGFEPHRVDEDCVSNTIQNRIIERLVKAPMVLCDLSTRNPNVLYELGLRHAFDKPVLLVQEEGTQGIFDIANITTISYRSGRIYDEILEDQDKIARSIKETYSSLQKYSVLSTYKLNAAPIKSASSMSSTDKISLQLSIIGASLDQISERLNKVEKESLRKNKFSYDFVRANENIKKLIHATSEGERCLLNASDSADKEYKIKVLEKQLDSLNQALEGIQDVPISEFNLDEVLPRFFSIRSSIEKELIHLDHE